MRTVFKILASAAAVLTAACFLSGCSEKDALTGVETAVKHFPADKLQSVCVTSHWLNVKLAVDAEKAGTVEYTIPDDVKLNVDFADGVLLVEESTPFKVVLRHNGAYSVTIWLDSEQVLSTLTVEMRSGDLTLRDVKLTGAAILALSSGELRLQTSSFDTLDVTTSSGDAKISDTTCTGAFTLTSSSGDVELNRLSAASVQCDTSSGEITFDDLHADAVDLKSSSGDIEGTLSGKPQAYTAKTSTSSGSVHISGDASGGEKQLTVKTSSGDIDIDFE